MRSSPASGTIDGLQVLRAVAAIMVAARHANHSVPGAEWLLFGGAGVDIFFVISGYVMAFTTKSAPPGKESAVRFMLKRIARIVPLYWLALLWCARRDFGDPDLFREFLFLPRPSGENALPQGWTLDFEMAFYALFAVCFLFPRRLLVLVCGIAIMPLLGSLLPGFFGEFYSDPIVLEFAFGVLLHEAVKRWGYPELPRAVWLALLGAGFVALAVLHDTGFVARALFADVYPRPLAQGLPAVLIVWASFQACDGWLRSRLLRLLGDASYSIYLFHFSSFGAVKPLARMIGPEWVSTLMIAHILVAVVSGCLIHLIVEKPLTRIAKMALGLRSSKRRIEAPSAT